MAYKGKRARPRLTVEQMTLITLACSFFALGFALCNLFWAVASAKAPEPTPEPTAAVDVDEGRLPGDDIPATEYAVWTGPRSSAWESSLSPTTAPASCAAMGGRTG